MYIFKSHPGLRAGYRFLCILAGFACLMVIAGLIWRASGPTVIVTRPNFDAAIIGTLIAAVIIGLGSVLLGRLALAAETQDYQVWAADTYGLFLNKHEVHRLFTLVQHHDNIMLKVDGFTRLGHVRPRGVDGMVEAIYVREAGALPVGMHLVHLNEAALTPLTRVAPVEEHPVTVVTVDPTEAAVVAPIVDAPVTLTADGDKIVSE